MNKELFDKVVEIISPFAKNKDALKSVNANSNFLKDLQVSSSRLVDIILAFEDKFGITIGDDEADKIETVGAAIELIQAKSA
ncbi:MAG: acyl carrier protein [Oligoflexia bacterium]|nr:acyl carrier protein [Oligoflexia bacterium]